MTPVLAFTVAIAVLLDDQVTVLFVALDGTKTTENFPVLPLASARYAGLADIAITAIAGAVTVTVQVANISVFEKGATAMTADPIFFAVTIPLESTVATAVLLDRHVTFLFGVLAGKMVVLSCSVLPTSKVSAVLFRVILVAAKTVATYFAMKFPSTVVAVIVADPFPLAVTIPVLSTVAIAALLDFQVTFLFAAVAGLTVAASFCV